MTRHAALLLTLAVTALPARAEPAGTWQRYVTPAEAGWSEDGLEAARTQAEAIGSAAVMVIDRGHVVAAWGEVATPLPVYSVRKSLLSLLIGQAVAEGELALDATLAESGLTDREPLTETEAAATLAEVLTSTTGIYLPAAKEPPGLAERPERGQDAPGEVFWYNNWSFNAAQTIWAEATGLDLAGAFADRIAGPLGFEDLAASDVFLEYDPSKSDIPAWEMMLSARDLARVGVLVAQEGRWSGEAVVPRDWLAEALRAHWDFGDGSGYGYLWWVSPAEGTRFGGPGTGLPGDAAHVAAIGAFGQAIWVLPEEEIVIVHRARRSATGGVSDREVEALVRLILEAKVSAGAADPRLEPLAVPPTGPLLHRDLVAPDAAERERLAGRYGPVEVYGWGGRLYISPPEPGGPHMELLRQPDGSYTGRLVPVRITFEGDAFGRAAALTLEMGGREMRALRN